MNTYDDSTVGGRIRLLRKRRGYSQTELAKLMGKSLRTIQKYESGEIEVSIATINELAKLLDTTSTYLIGQQAGDFGFESFADVVDCLFQLERISGLKFSLDVRKPPRDDCWQCSITFDGKAHDADQNADMCLFLEDWMNTRQEYREGSISKADYERWKDETIAYYAPDSVEMSDT